MKMWICLMIAAISYSAMAEDRADNRQNNQDQRIQQGEANGSLRNGEARKLERQQNRIETREAHLKADGDFSARDKMKVERMQDRANRNIARKKHNNRNHR